MNDERTAALLEDVARLLKKHGPDAFEELAQLLRSPGFTEGLADLLRTSAAVGRAERARRDARPRIVAPDPIPGAIKDLDPEKYRLLVQIRERLVRGGALPRLRDVVELAEQHGIILKGPRSRARAVASLIEGLLTRSVEEIGAVAKLLEPQSGASSLQAWSDIILRKGAR